MMFRKFKDGNIEYYFERRRYGAYGTNRFFCWMIYHFEGEKTWNYAPGDPWQKVTPNKAEVYTTLAAIRLLREQEQAQ